MQKYIYYNHPHHKNQTDNQEIETSDHNLNLQMTQLF